MFQSKRALVTESAAFVFLKMNAGKDEAYINYKAISTAMQLAGLDFSSVQKQYIKALEELAEYKENND